jgi:hypothetical protein
MPEPEDEVERVLEAAIWRCPKGDLAALARAVLEELWEAGYDVTRRSDVIPMRRNPQSRGTEKK